MDVAPGEQRINRPGLDLALRRSGKIAQHVLVLAQQVIVALKYRVESMVLADPVGECRIAAIERERIDGDALIVLVLSLQPASLVGIHLEQMKIDQSAQVAPAWMQSVAGAGVDHSASQRHGMSF